MKLVFSYNDRWEGDGFSVTENNYLIFYVTLNQEEACCGFSVLQGFKFDQLKKEYVSEIGERLRKYLSRKKIKYVPAFVPDTKHYQPIRDVLAVAGFKPVVSLKSKMGKYTNTRWDWLAPKFQPLELFPKGMMNEKNVPAHNV